MREALETVFRRAVIAVIGIVTILSAAFAVIMLLLVVLFLGNFNFQKPSHLGIFLETWLFIALGLAAPVSFFLRVPSAVRYLLVVAAAALAVLTNWLWAIPAARDLIH